ncbi:MAG: NUDIX domain-containing protein [Pseudonocardiaceae bacterium]
MRQLGKLAQAQRHAERIIELRPVDHTRSRALGQLMLVTVLIEQGQPEQACTVAQDVLDATQWLSSYQVIEQLRGLHRLLAPHHTNTVVKDFLEFLGEVLRQRAWLDQWPAKLYMLVNRRLDEGDMDAEVPLYQRDPGAWRKYLAEGNAKQARKRVGADALLQDEHGRILLVDPKYKPDWDLPGGMAEANEPPLDALRRELEEELGHNVRAEDVTLLCVDWVSPHDPWDDSLMFIFDAGALTTQQASALRLADGELAAYEFCTPTQVEQRLRPYVWRRVAAALQALESRCATYLHDGHPV